MFTLVIVVFLNLRMNPQVTEKTFDKLSDCEVAAHIPRIGLLSRFFRAGR
jgi:hypothetical protein